MEMTPGFLARSLAGNDKGRRLCQIQEDLGTHVLLLRAENGRVLSERIRSMSSS